MNKGAIDIAICYIRGYLHLVPRNLLPRISELPRLTDETRVPTQACLEEHSLTELNETCPLYGLRGNCLLATQTWLIKQQ